MAATFRDVIVRYSDYRRIARYENHLQWEPSEAGLIVGDKRGRWIWYRALPERLAQLRAALA